MPPNVTSLIQPMDQNIIRLVKLHYKTSILSKIIAEDKDPVHNILKKVTLRDAIVFLENAWKKIDKEVISKCWKLILTEAGENEYSSEDEIPLSTLQNKILTERFGFVDTVRNLLSEIDKQVKIYFFIFIYIHTYSKFCV